MDVTRRADAAGGTGGAGDKVVDQVGARCQKLFLDFLNEWPEEAGVSMSQQSTGGSLKYLSLARELTKQERNTLVVSMKDLELFNPTLAARVTEDYFRLYPYLCSALKTFVRERCMAGGGTGEKPEGSDDDKEYYVSFVDVDGAYNMRKLSTAKIGSLVRVVGQVVRTHPVHPELVSGIFTCLDCQTVITDVEQQFKYTQPSICRNPVCNNRSRFLLDVNRSRFVDFQKVRVQEIQSELPRGCIPRSLDVVVRAEAVESAQPGDRCDFVGTLIVVPDVGALGSSTRAESAARHKAETADGAEGVRGLKSLGVRDLHYRIAFLACSVTSSRKTLGQKTTSDEEATPQAIKESMSEAEWDTIYKMSQDKVLYQNLINSLFPTIHGNDEVKRGILLMLFGGVPKVTLEGTTLRGDLNVCIVGDPSTAKSQFLKQVADFSPRAVYTSGKASSAAGLTAAVVKDEESAEFVIEAGALMLADNGICCIDEFDKMEVHDQVAIHEAMEQQTISITKAGVKATLNARASILAAANPISGRYDRTKSLKQNVQMSAPIMSRFDLFFILVDDANEVTDYAIARRIVDLHSKLEESVDRVYQPEDVRRYLGFARLFKPKITIEAMDFLVEQYRHLRQRDSGGGVKSSWRITVRQLESMIRLAESMARMHCSDQVLPKHVKEAYRLLNKSIIRVDQPEVHLEEEEEENEEDEQGEEAAQPMDQDGEDANAASRADPQQKKQLRLSYEDYRAMANLMVHYLRRREAETERSATSAGGADTGTRKSDLLNWYLGEIEGEIESTEELSERKQVAEKVIDRLTYQDNVLIPLIKTGLAKKKGSSGTGSGVVDTSDDPVLLVHPNYVSDE